MLFVNSLCDGKGYAGWSRAFVIALSAKNKLGMIDGSTVRNLERISNKVWSVHRSTTLSSAKGTIRCRHAVQGNLDIASYFTKFKKIWDELDAIITFDHCTCKCICGCKVKTIKSHQDGRLIQFLMVLNNSHSSVKRTILMMNPLPTVSSAYFLLIQDEKQKEVHREAHPSESAFMVSNPRFSSGQRFANNNTQKNNNNGARFGNNYQKYGWSDGKLKGNFNKQNSGLFCTNCKMTNHNVSKCYRLIGFPPDFKFTRPKKNRFQTHTNATSVVSDQNNNHAAPDGNFSTFRKQMTPEQHSQLVTLLQHYEGQDDASC
ncbi:uncharacterized protein LOC132050787 [Lycium ferocissimum]|uniref:uncharacterized protein LOC132050787 n=1 Tax=Lycium ferocissimum TaxID=112874 RepID=UPI002815F5BF|nr:uncharacterized protein LOC132050787 [Lycium ferocissimum]